MATTDGKEPSSSKYRLYKQVEADLRSRVSRGEWGADSPIPRRRDLAHEYDIDVNTLQRAILPLVADGTLRAEGKGGTFINERSGAPLVKQSTLKASSLNVRSHVQSGSRLLAHKTVGVVAQLSLSQPFGTNTAAVHTRDVVRSIESACLKAGGQSRLFNTYKEEGLGCGIKQAVAALLGSKVDALVILDIYDNPAVAFDLCSIDLSEDFPLVYVSSVANFVPHLHVFYDQRHAGYIAARHLIERGWKDITFVAPYRANWVEDRIAGARLAMERSDSTGCTFRVVPLSRLREQYEAEDADVTGAIIQEALRRGSKPGALIAPNDSFARTVYAVANTMELVMGRDYALAGFDDDIESSSMGLTSVRPPLEEMGETAVRLLSRCIVGEPVNLHICLRSHVAARSSTPPTT